MHPASLAAFVNVAGLAVAGVFLAVRGR
jgi:hypothetical protein